MLNEIDMERKAKKPINYYIKYNGYVEEASMPFDMSNVLYVKEINDDLSLVLNGADNTVEIRLKGFKQPVSVLNGSIEFAGIIIQFMKGDHISYLVTYKEDHDGNSSGIFGAIFGPGTVCNHHKKSLGYMLDVIENK